ncbi:hypothetical protein YO5_15580 [Stutzerimonas stutzeri TS44]|nr:hypothetical protein YO5_15580 [Stutzerimonas stutzeri TS44]
MNTAQHWMKAGRTLGLALLVGQAAHAAPQQATSPTAPDCTDIAGYESAIKTPPRTTCPRPRLLRAVAIPTTSPVHVTAEPAVRPYLPSTSDTRRYSF